MNGICAWLLLSLGAAMPQQLSHTLAVSPSGEPAKKGCKSARGGPQHSKRAPTPAQPATRGPQLQSKRTLLPLPTQYRAVALWPLLVDEGESELAEQIESATSDAIEAIAAFRPISSRDVASDLSAQGEASEGCDRDVVCTAQLGRLTRAHLVLEMRLVPAGGTTTLHVRLIDTQTEGELVRLEEPLAATVAERETQLHGIVVQCLTPTEYVGSLLVRCDAKGAQAFLDGQLLGALPLPPLPRVTAGVHVLRVVRPGHSDVHRFIDVQFGRANIVTIHGLDDKLSFESVLQDAPFVPPPPKPIIVVPDVPPHFPSWRTWTAVGLAGAGALGVGAGGYLASELNALNAEQRRDAAALQAVVLGDPTSINLVHRLAHLNMRGPRLERAQWAAVGTGAGLISVGAAFVAWDWLRVHRATQAHPLAPANAVPLTRPVTLVPTFCAGRLGLQLDVAL